MHIVIAPDSYKGSLSSIEVGHLIETGLKKAIPSIQTTIFPMADGGEGTMDAFLYHLGGEKHELTVKDPLLRDHQAHVSVTNYKNKTLAIIESASLIGLPLLTDAEKKPLIASSKGLGEAVSACLDKGIRNFIIGLGGSATNDAGLGMLEALGVHFYDNDHNRLHNLKIEDIYMIKRADLSTLDSRITQSTITIASDVDNPLCGPRGASAVFGPQKGATSEMVFLLDEALAYFSTLFSNGQKLKEKAGAGAAGGLGFASLLIGATLQSGSKIIAEALEIEKSIQTCDLFITGEGKSDNQTLYGKAPFYLANLAKKHEKPVIMLSGSLGDGYLELSDYVDAFFSIIERPVTTEEAMQHGKQWLEATSFNIGCLLKINS